jgi:1,4-alpha-glucan branching enzyme
MSDIISNQRKTAKTAKNSMQPRNVRSTTVARPVAPTTRSGERPEEKPIEFVFHMPQAQSAAVAGTFNNWDPKRTPMRKDPSGDWKATLWLPPGRYEYRFIVDGQWLNDPRAKESAPNGFGSANSVASV